MVILHVAVDFVPQRRDEAVEGPVVLAPFFEEAFFRGLLLRRPA